MRSDGLEVRGNKYKNYIVGNTFKNVSFRRVKRVIDIMAVGLIEFNSNSIEGLFLPSLIPDKTVYDLALSKVRIPNAFDEIVD